MRKSFLFMLTAALFAFSGSAFAEWRVESIDNDFQYEIESAGEENKTLILFFHQAGCPYCDKMRSRVLPAPKVNTYFDKHFVMIESNIRGNLAVVTPAGEEMTEVEFGHKSRVRATPVFIFYGKDGEQALRTTGYLDPDRFVLAGRYVAEGVYKTGVSFFRYIREQEKAK